MTLKNIEKSILRLSPAKRIWLAQNILASLQSPDPNIERAADNESEKRLKDYKNGKTKAIPLAAVKKQFGL